MTALLILVGGLLFLVSWLWLWLRASGTHWSWILLGVLPPLGWGFALRHWRDNLLPLALLLASGGLLGAGFWQLQQQEPQRFQQLLSLDWLTSLTQPPATDFQGQWSGQPFAPELISFTQGQLLLREGDEQQYRAVRIDFAALQSEFTERFEVSVLPSDQEAQFEVELTWLDAPGGLPEARRLNRGYSLHLAWAPEAEDGRLHGQLSLSLPQQFATVVKGEFVVPAQMVVKTIPEEQAVVAPQPVLEPPAPVSVVEAAARLPLSVLLQAMQQRPQAYLYQQVQIETHQGRRIQGQFEGIGEAGELIVVQYVHRPGAVTFSVQPADIKQLTLR